MFINFLLLNFTQVEVQISNKMQIIKTVLILNKSTIINNNEY